VPIQCPQYHRNTIFSFKVIYCFKFFVVQLFSEYIITNMCLTISNKHWRALPYIFAKFSKDFIFFARNSLMLCAVLYDLTQILYMYTFSIGDYLGLDITIFLAYTVNFSSSTSIIIPSRANRMPSTSEKHQL
jgi:hypothetical protein